MTARDAALEEAVPGFERVLHADDGGEVDAVGEAVGEREAAVREGALGLVAGGRDGELLRGHGELEGLGAGGAADGELELGAEGPHAEGEQAGVAAADGEARERVRIGAGAGGAEQDDGAIEGVLVAAPLAHADDVVRGEDPRRRLLHDPVGSSGWRPCRDLYWAGSLKLGSFGSCTLSSRSQPSVWSTRLWMATALALASSAGSATNSDGQQRWHL